MARRATTGAATTDAATNATARTGTAATGTAATGTAATVDQLAAFKAANARLESTTESLSALGLPLDWPDPSLDATPWDLLSKLVG